MNTDANILHLIAETPLPDFEGEESSKPFAFLRVGTFVDRNGKKHTFTRERLDELVAAFRAGKAGQDVPVDVQHRRDEAAGWIKNIYREGDRLFAVPDWNELGLQLVGDKVYRYVSATIQTAQKALLSISLTNFPAVQGLPALELSSLLTQDDPDPTTPGDDPEPTEQEPPEATLPMSKKIEPKSDDLEFETPTDPIDPNENPGNGEDPKKPQTQASSAADAVREVIDVELSSLRDEMKSAMTETMTEATKEIAKMRKDMLAEFRSDLREEQELTELSHKLTGEGQHALPVKADELQVMLSGIPASKRQPVIDMLTAVTEAGTVDFSETGTSEGDNTQPENRDKLDSATAALLADFMKDEGATAKQFFALNADVLNGGVDDYDLSEFEQ